MSTESRTPSRATTPTSLSRRTLPPPIVSGVPPVMGGEASSRATGRGAMVGAGGYGLEHEGERERRCVRARTGHPREVHAVNTEEYPATEPLTRGTLLRRASPGALGVPAASLLAAC